MDEMRVREIIKEELSSLLKIDRYVFEKLIQIADGRNIQLSPGTGTKIGTAIGQKIGFLGKSPVSQQTTVTAPSGGGSSSTDAIDISGRTAINQIKAILTAFGFTA